MQKQNEIVLILGKKGSGKTSRAWSLITEIKRLVIFDFNREYSGFYVVSNPEQLIKTLQLNFESDFRICYQPSAEMDVQEHFNALSNAVFCMSNVTLLAEEVDLVSSAGDIPPGLRKIINYGRHRSISLIALSRRAHRVPRDLSANADRIITFAQFEPRDIKYLADYMGVQAAEEVTRLKRTDTGAEFLEWSESGVRKSLINFIDKTIQPGKDSVSSIHKPQPSTSGSAPPSGAESGAESGE